MNKNKNNNKQIRHGNIKTDRVATSEHTHLKKENGYKK